MTQQLKTLTLDGYEFNLDAQAAQVIQRLFRDHERLVGELNKQIDAFKKKAAEKEEEDEEDEEENAKKDALLVKKDEDLKAKDVEIVTLKTQLKEAQDKTSPAAIDLASRIRYDVIQKGRKIMGDRLMTDDKSVEEIRRQVVEAKVGAVAHNWNDDNVMASFHTLAEPATTQQLISPVGHVDQARQFFGQPGRGYLTLEDAKEEAYRKYNDDISNAWRTPHPAPQH